MRTVKKAPPLMQFGKVRKTHGVFSSRVQREAEKAASILARKPHNIRADLVKEYGYYRVLIKRDEFYRGMSILRAHGFPAIVEGS